MLLSAGLISPSLAKAEAVVVSVPGVLARVLSVTVAVLPLATLPRAQMIRPPALLQLPWLEVNERTERLAGNVFVRITPVALPGPWFLTWTVRVKLALADTGSADLVMVVARSTPGSRLTA